MQTRRLGRTDLVVSRICLGSMTWGQQNTEEEGHAQMDLAFSRGVNFIDTAELYPIPPSPETQGRTERIIGTWMKARGNRDKVILASKVVGRTSNDWFRGGRPSRLVRADIMDAVDKSLARLQTDYIDLYQSHRDDPETPQEETAEAFDRLVKAGKVRAIGSSNFTPERLKSALEISEAKGLARYDSEQPLYNLYARAGFENGLQRACIENEVGVIPYSSLASGFLTGKYRTEADLSKSPRGGGVKKMMDERGMRILAALDQISAAKSGTQAQVALAWVMAQPGLTGPIASATSLSQLDELMGAARMKLTDEDLTALDRASAP